MAEQKIFAGPRVRRLRNGLELTQTAMAEELGISPSYLNLIERNQRPLTVQLLLKLSARFKIDLEDLQGPESGTASALKEVFSDPLIADELPGDQELIEFAEAAPNAAAGVVKLYRAYREQAARLSDLSALLAREGHETVAAGARLPIDEVRERFERRPYHFDALDRAAEDFHGSLETPDGLEPALRAWLKRERGIVVRSLPVHVMPDLRRRFDRHSMRLFLSERLSPFDRLREMAAEACQLALREAIAAELDGLGLASDEARRLARFELARYAAHAVLMPYEAFLTAAQRACYDVDVLRSRFQVSYEQAANRLVTLQRPGREGVPFFLLEIDNAGHVLRRAGARGYPQGRFGGDCPKLNIHSAFSQPGQILVDAVEVAEGTAFLVVSRTLEGPQAAFNERVRRTALLLGCDLSRRDEVVYGQTVEGVAGNAGQEPVGQLPLVGVGTACRLCERTGCLARAEPPVTRPLGLDEMVAGLSAFDFR